MVYFASREQKPGNAELRLRLSQDEAHGDAREDCASARSKDAMKRKTMSQVGKQKDRNPRASETKKKVQSRISSLNQTLP